MSIALTKYKEAFRIIIHGHQIAQRFISEEIAQTIISECDEAFDRVMLPFSRKDFLEANRGTPENYGTPKTRFLLPEGMSRNSKFYTILMTDNRFQSYGLETGMFAVVQSQEKYLSGEFLAVKNILTETIHCGIADLGEMYIALEAPNSKDLQPLYTHEVAIMGKIVGKGTFLEDNYERIMVVEKLDLDFQS